MSGVTNATKINSWLAKNNSTKVLLWGINIQGVEKKSIQQAKLSVKVPLCAGTHEIPGNGQNIITEIKENSVAELIIEIKRDNNKKFLLEKFSLAFSHKLTIRNPNESLDLSSNGARFMKKIKDKLAHVGVKSIEILQGGTLLVDGSLKFINLLKHSIKVDLSKKIPEADKRILKLLGLDNKRGVASKNSLELNPRKILGSLGAMMAAASYTLDVKLDPPSIDYKRKANLAHICKKPIQVHLEGSFDFNNSGALFFNIDGSMSEIDSAMGKIKPNLKGAVTDLFTQSPTSYDITGSATSTSQDVKINFFAPAKVSDFNIRKRQDYRSGSTKKQKLSLEAKDIRIDTEFNLRGQRTKNNNSFVVHTNSNFNAKKICVKIHERKIDLDGDISGRLRSNNIRYDAKNGFTGTTAQVSLGVAPSKKMRKLHPEMSPVVWDYRVALKPQGGSIIVPPEQGISRLFRPVANLEGHFERVNTSATKMAVHNIGSRKYFQNICYITGSKPRGAKNIKLLFDGKNSLPERLKLINQAKETIYFQTLVFKNDKTGKQIAQALVQAQKRGVRVCGIIDSLGNVEKLSDLEHDNAIYSYLVKNKIKLHVYNNNFERGMRSIFKIIEKNSDIFTSKFPSSISSVAQLMEFLEEVVEATDNKKSKLKYADREKIKRQIQSIFYVSKYESGENIVNKLGRALQNKITSLAELLGLIKRISLVSNRWHEKYLIADYNLAILGGMNIADEYLLGGSRSQVNIKGKLQPAWRDIDVLLEGEAVVDINSNFQRNWEFVSGEKLKKNIPDKSEQINTINKYQVNIIQHRPYVDGDHNITNFLLYNLRCLHRGQKAWFETAYFLPRGVLRVLQKELIKAAQRGIDVRILTNGSETSDFSLIPKTAIFDYRELIKSGAKIYRRNRDRMVHAKAAVLGDSLTLVGSWNFDNRSAAHDSEVIAAIHDKSIAKNMSEQLKIDMNIKSTQIQKQDVGPQNFGKELGAAAKLMIAELV